MDWAAAQAPLRGPVFEPLSPFLARLDPARWPTLDDLNALAEGIATAGGRTIRFVPPGSRRDPGRPYYERRVADAGEVETRERNWHDLFNALAWMAFPRAKAAINAQHAAMLEEGGPSEARYRSPERDALTLFDEGGVAVASSSAALLRLIVDFEWKELFWTRREELAAKVRFFAFGHSLYEKALDPFTGIVAKTVFLPVDELFAMLPAEAQVARVDAMLAAHFAHRARFPTPRAMAPIPAMGIPGWHPGTAREDYYDDPVHFRSRRAAPGGGL